MYCIRSWEHRDGKSSRDTQWREGRPMCVTVTEGDWEGALEGALHPLRRIDK